MGVGASVLRYVPLHGEKGGAMCCLTCVGAWHAEHGRRRNRGRVAIRAMMGFLDAGGRVVDLENLKLTAMVKDVAAFDIDYLHGVANSADEVIELTLELLTDVLTLVHPDKHPPEQRDSGAAGHGAVARHHSCSRRRSPRQRCRMG